MNKREKFDRRRFWVLEKIWKLYNKPHTLVRYSSLFNFDAPDFINDDLSIDSKIVGDLYDFLIKEGVIVERQRSSSFVHNFNPDDFLYAQIEIREARFKLLFEEYEANVEEWNKRRGLSDGLIDIFIDKQKGIYRIQDGNELIYPIRSYSKKFRTIIGTLCKNKSFFSNLLVPQIYKNNSFLNKEIKSINKLFQKYLELPNIELIVHSDASGYQFNKKRLKINTEI